MLIRRKEKGGSEINKTDLIDASITLTYAHCPSQETSVSSTVVLICISLDHNSAVDICAIKAKYEHTHCCRLVLNDQCITKKNRFHVNFKIYVQQKLCALSSLSSVNIIFLSLARIHFSHMRITSFTGACVLTKTSKVMEFVCKKIMLTENCGLYYVFSTPVDLFDIVFCPRASIAEV